MYLPTWSLSDASFAGTILVVTTFRNTEYKGFNDAVQCRHRFLTLAVAVLAICIVPCFATETWFNQRVTWKYGKEGLEWKTVIRNPHGQGEYQLVLSSLWAVEGGVIAVEIVIARPAQPNVNLLGERKNGVEYPFVITVQELQKRVAKSKFGAVRNFQIDNIVLPSTSRGFVLDEVSVVAARSAGSARIFKNFQCVYLSGVVFVQPMRRREFTMVEANSRDEFLKNWAYPPLFTSRSCLSVLTRA